METSIRKNASFNFIKTICSVAFPVITFVYTSRVLGVEGMGKVSFSKSVITYFSMIAMLGINQYGTREAAKIRKDKSKLSLFTQEILLINLLTTLFSYVLLFFSIRLIGKLKNYECLLWVNSVSIFLQGMGMEWFYQAMEEYKYIAKKSILFQVISLGALFVFVRDRSDILAFTVISVFALSGSNILNFYHMGNYVKFKWLSKLTIKRHIVPMLWLFAMAASIELYTVLDTTMLGFFCNDRAVGLYNAAIKVNRMTISIITSIGVVLIPRLSYYIETGENEKLKSLVKKGYNYIFLFSIPAAIGLFLLSDDIIILFSGEEYCSAGLTMRIMTLIVIVIPFSVMTNQQTLVPLGKEKWILFSTCIGAIVNFACNFFLIPKYAENGAAIGTIIAELAVAAICLYNASHLLNIKEVFTKYHQYWLASLPIIIISLCVKMWNFSYVVEMAFTIIISLLLYCLVLYFLKNEFMLSILNMISSKLRYVVNKSHD